MDKTMLAKYQNDHNKKLQTMHEIRVQIPIVCLPGAQNTLAA
jgi:hypothetical protein